MKSAFSVANLFSRIQSAKNIAIDDQNHKQIDAEVDEPYFVLYISLQEGVPMVEVPFAVKTKKGSLIWNKNKKAKDGMRLSMKNLGIKAKKPSPPSVCIDDIKAWIDQKYDGIDWDQLLDGNGEMPSVYAGDTILNDYEHDIVPIECFEFNDNGCDEYASEDYSDEYLGIPLVFILEDYIVDYENKLMDEEEEEKLRIEREEDENKKQKEAAELKAEQQNEMDEQQIVLKHKIISSRYHYLRYNTYGSYSSLSSRHLYYLFHLPLYQYEGKDPPWIRKQYKQSKRQGEFSLPLILTKIGCEVWMDVLIERGLNEKEVFMRIAEEELEGEGIWMPKKTRKKILTLAKAIYDIERKKTKDRKILSRYKRIQKLKREALGLRDDITVMSEETEEDIDDIDLQRINSTIHLLDVDTIENKKTFSKATISKVCDIINEVEYQNKSNPVMINELKECVYSEMDEHDRIQLEEANRRKNKKKEVYCCEYHLNRVIYHYKNLIDAHRKEAVADASFYFQKYDYWKNGYISKSDIIDISQRSVRKTLESLVSESKTKETKNINQWARLLADDCSTASKQKEFMADLLIDSIGNQVAIIQKAESGMIEQTRQEL